jgi:hypothetical protein
MSQLYRGGSYVDTEQSRTDLISSVSDSGFGQGGYSKRFNYGNLNNWSFSTSGNPPQNYYGGRFIFQMGYLYNGQTGSSDLQSLNSSNAGGTRTEAAYYMYNGAAKNYDSGAVLYYACTHGMSASSPHTLNVTFAVAGLYLQVNRTPIRTIKVIAIVFPEHHQETLQINMLMDTLKEILLDLLVLTVVL